jgi:hypothetical protein
MIDQDQGVVGSATVATFHLLWLSFSLRLVIFKSVVILFLWFGDLSICISKKHSASIPASTLSPLLQDYLGL